MDAFEHESAVSKIAKFAGQTSEEVIANMRELQKDTGLDETAVLESLLFLIPKGRSDSNQTVQPG